MLKGRPPIERLALRLVTTPGQRILSTVAVIGGLFPLIAPDGSLLLSLTPAILAAGLSLITGAAIPDWRWLAVGASVILAALAITLVEEAGSWAGWPEVMFGLVLLAAWILLMVALGRSLRWSPLVRMSASS
jgi:hypothetical protein